MTDNEQSHGSKPGGGYPERWNEPLPKVLSEPTYWPLVLSVGIALLAWGVVTSYPLSILGLIMCVVALVFWIGDIRREQQHEIDQ